MIDLRLFYRKTGALRFISHLDTARLFARAARKSGLPIWYTEGFNPHPFFTFAQPLSLMFESDCESVDFRITEEVSVDTVEEKFRKVLPQGIDVIRVSPPRGKPKDICRAVYYVRIFADDLNETTLFNVNGFFKQDLINVTKKSKKGIAVVDIKPHIYDLKICLEKESIGVNITLPSGVDFSVNPMLVFDALGQFLNTQLEYRVRKISVLMANGEVFS